MKKITYEKPEIRVTDFDNVTSAVLMSIIPPGGLGNPVSLPPPPTQS